MPCPCCGPQTANCNCSCPGPSYGPISETFVYPPSPTRCIGSSYGEGWNGAFGNPLPASQILNPCYAFFPPQYEQDCGGLDGPWKQDDGNNCDLEWVADGATPYINADCTIYPWFSASTRTTHVEKSGEEFGCECFYVYIGHEYVVRLYVLNCETGMWEDKTETLLKRYKFRICGGGLSGPDCGISKPNPQVLFYDAPIPPATLPGCNPLP